MCRLLVTSRRRKKTRCPCVDELDDGSKVVCACDFSLILLNTTRKKPLYPLSSSRYFHYRGKDGKGRKTRTTRRKKEVDVDIRKESFAMEIKEFRSSRFKSPETTRFK